MEAMVTPRLAPPALVPWTAILLLHAGCVLSVSAIVPASEAIVDPRLVGTWEEVAGSDRAVISRASEHSYAIEYTSDGTASRFEARLDSLGGRWVLDVWPTPTGDELPEPYASLMIAGHALFVLDIASDEVQMATPEPDSLLARFRTGRIQLAHERTEDQLILHGTTDQLREVFRSYLGNSGALTDPVVWRRSPERGALGPPSPVSVPCFEASAWRDADQLFQRDPHWVGGDGASSVLLGNGRILWLFGDSWIDPTGRRTRQGARMISNSVAIQTGTDPLTASLRFHWRQAPDGSPMPFIPDDGPERHWFGNGVRVGDRLLLFVNGVHSTETGLGVESVGWSAWLVDNPDAEPPAWRMRRLATRANRLGVLIGFAAVLPLGDHVYAFGSQDPVKSHPLYAVRWPAPQARQGDLWHPEWWAGDRLGWVSDSSRAPRLPLFEHGQSELTIHVDDGTHHFLAIHTQGFGPADVMMRAAPTLTGPWSAPRMVYRPSEYYRPHAMIYAAKAHPELTGADLVLTYVNNSVAFAEHLSDPRIYYPRFVRLTHCR